MPNSIARIVLSLFALCLLNQAIAQSTTPFKIKEIGTPIINSYLPTDYGAHEQTYSICQDTTGLMYFANVTGIIEYDGNKWSVDSRVSDDAFKGVAIDQYGKIYGASRSDFGYFKPDAVGALEFVSLVPKTPKTFADKGSLTSVDYLNGHVIMRSATALLNYDVDHDTMKVIPGVGRLGIADIVDGEYLVIDYQTGLNRLVNGALEPVKGGEVFKSLGVRKMVRFAENELLIVTKEKGLFTYDFEKLTPWKTEVSDLLSAQFGFSGLTLFDQYFAIGTETGGVYIINKEGRLIQKLDKSTGLSNALVQDLYLDKDQNLWVAQHGLISQVILNSPFTTLDERHGINGYVLYFMRHQEGTYVATATGISYHNDADPWQKTGDYKPFRTISANTDRAWMFAKSGKDFFALGNMGLWQINGTDYREIYSGERLWAVTVFEEQDRMVAGSIEDYLHLFEKVNGRWQHGGKIKGFHQPMDFLERTDEGDLWMTDSGIGVFKIKLNQQGDSVLWSKKYGQAQGLPTDERNRVFRHKEGLLFTTAEGIYRYDAEADYFFPDETFNQHLGKDYVFRFIEMENETIYASLNPKGKALLKKKAGGYEFSQYPFDRIDSHNSEYVSGLGGSDIWIAGSGIKHYDHTINQRPAVSFKAHIRNVNLSANDSLLYAGAGKWTVKELKPKQNAIKFSYTANFFDDRENIEYQSYLEGTEDDWSGWNNEPFRNYTNLPHGEYTFKVRARNVYGEISETSTYSFVIITPWYLTSLAYVVYIMLTVLFVVLIVRAYAGRLKLEKAALEHMVSQRTKVILQQKEAAEKHRELIQSQADRLKELDQVKSRFFANISHELRTPLTLINAPLEKLISEKKIEDPDVRQTLESIKKNGVSLLSLVEEILDLAKLDAGKLKLVQNPVRICNCLRELCEEFDLGFREKGVSFEHNIQVDMGLAVILDENKCGKIMKNLLSNALKFTPKGGEVAVILKHIEATGMLSLMVTDTGKGIHPNDLPYIFDRYYQSEQPGKKAEGGTGIGLALALELARLQGGDLTATSELGQGSSFELTVPYKEVAPELVKELIKVDNQSLEAALADTIERYNAKFEIDQPTLLVTEDHAEMREFIVDALAPYFNIIQAPNGVVALQSLEAQNVDILISDVMMPQMDGFELLTAVRKDERLHDLSVIMLTARADEEDKLFALTLGIDDYITKPFSAAEFLARIKNILENRIKIIRELKKLRNPEQPEVQQDFLEQYGLSDRELEVMQLLAKRLTNVEMAEQLHISNNTVKYHIKNLYLKLDISSRAEAARKAESLLGNPAD